MRVSSDSRNCWLTARPTTQIAPVRRSIQMTICSSSPRSSTPTSTRSAYRPSRDRRFMPGIQSRPVAVFKNLYSFLFQRGSNEEHVARYVVREHDRGRALNEILEDRYVQNRLAPEQQRRLLDRPALIEAFSGDPP